MISALQHTNLVKLFGCCIEGKELLSVYEYLKNNSLARALFGDEDQKLNLDWATRKKICMGIARGLAYLHEESRLKIVHRDIKATNVLLDKDLNAKISDFGLAKLDEEENTHISTRIAGTIGYMAPEYVMRGYLTDKADVYSFGVVALLIVSGKSNTNYRPKEDFVYLLDWACVLQEQGNLLELVDPSLGKYSKQEAMMMINLALLCTNASPSLRPPMSAVVKMLEGKMPVQPPIVKRDAGNPDMRFKAFDLILHDSQTQLSTILIELNLLNLQGLHEWDNSLINGGEKGWLKWSKCGCKEKIQQEAELMENESDDSSFDDIECMKRVLGKRCGHIRGVGHVVRKPTHDMPSIKCTPTPRQFWKQSVTNERMQQDFDRQMEQMHKGLEKKYRHRRGGLSRDGSSEDEEN
ncbi:putative LRR receptor-like serine/threonine-protein kinase At1g53430 [Bidens hawaiensis]|uniref:putative LRR receptor-like serine/threonine-protein kinase At1g53430 n=1 Tax=Bidens hawaiensis TaxID=980011 RepID=UPI00404AF978